MNTRQFLEEKQQKGRLYFTLEEAMKALHVSKKNVLSRIGYLKKKETIISPLKGYYIIVPLKDRIIGSLQPQNLVALTMKYLDVSYYVGLLSAARYHGATHQAAQVFQVITNKRIRSPWIIGRVNIEFIYKRNIEKTELENRVVNTGNLKISTAEQTCKDIMTYPDRVGGLNHQATILSELINAIHINKLIRIAAKENKKAWIQRLGYILDHINTMHNSKRDKVTDRLYKFLQGKKLDFTPLAPELGTIGHPKNEKWKIIENTNVESDL